MEIVLNLIDKTPYLEWNEYESTIDKDEPFYCKNIPSIKTIQNSGCNCAGLINILHLSRGLIVPGVISNYYYAGGTYAWFEYLNSINRLELICENKNYPAGSLLLRKYRNPDDQGHLAVLYTSGNILEQKLLHSYRGPGIKIDNTVRESHNWINGGYYEYICINWLNTNLESCDF